MKKMIFLPLFSLLLANAFAVNIISEDFYLNESESELRVLPNTLRLEMCEGESEELFADVFPYSEKSESFSWELCENNGAISIYPNGKSCTVVANQAGNEKIEISIRSGENALVDVEIEEKEEPEIRSFESEPSDKEEKNIFAEKVISSVVSGLTMVALSLLCSVFVLLMKERREKRKR